MKPTVKYGLLNGSMAILWSLLMYITELNRSTSIQWINILSMAIPIVFMVMVVKEYRSGPGNGWISFGKAFRQAFTVGVIGSVIGSLFYFLYISFIDPAFVDFQKQMQMESMAKRGMSDEMIERAMDQSAFFMQPGMQLVFAFIFGIFISAVLALIIAAIFKKPNPEEIA